MAIDPLQLRGYLQQAIGMLPIDITFDGVVYSGTKASRKDESELRVAGLLPENAFSVYLDLAGLHATPVVDETVTIDGIVQRIVSVGLDPGDAYIRLDLDHQFASRDTR